MTVKEEYYFVSISEDRKSVSSQRKRYRTRPNKLVKCCSDYCTNYDISLLALSHEDAISKALRIFDCRKELEK